VKNRDESKKNPTTGAITVGTTKKSNGKNLLEKIRDPDPDLPQPGD